MVNDPIADMLTRIRNAKAVAHNTVTIPFSNLKLKLAEILEKEGILYSDCNGILECENKEKLIINEKLNQQINFNNIYMFIYC